MVDHHVDRSGVEVQQCMKLTDTNNSIGLIFYVLEMNWYIQATLKIDEIKIYNLVLISCFVDLVVLAERLHTIPFRTRTLRAPAPMVLCLKARESRTLPGLLNVRLLSLYNYCSQTIL